MKKILIILISMSFAFYCKAADENAPVGQYVEIGKSISQLSSGRSKLKNNWDATIQLNKQAGIDLKRLKIKNKTGRAVAIVFLHQREGQSDLKEIIRIPSTILSIGKNQLEILTNANSFYVQMEQTNFYFDGNSEVADFSLDYNHNKPIKNLYHIEITEESKNTEIEDGAFYKIKIGSPEETDLDRSHKNLEEISGSKHFKIINNIGKFIVEKA